MWLLFSPHMQATNLFFILLKTLWRGNAKMWLGIDLTPHDLCSSTLFSNYLSDPLNFVLQVTHLHIPGSNSFGWVSLFIPKLRKAATSELSVSDTDTCIHLFSLQTQPSGWWLWRHWCRTEDFSDTLGTWASSCSKPGFSTKSQQNTTSMTD